MGDYHYYQKILPTSYQDTKVEDDTLLPLPLPSSGYTNRLEKFLLSSPHKEEYQAQRKVNAEKEESFRQFQIHFVNNFRKRTGDLSVDDYQSMLENIHGDMTQWDQYFGNHLGFVVETSKELNAYVSVIDKLNILYFDSRKHYNENSIYVEIPGGILYQILALEK